MSRFRIPVGRVLGIRLFLHASWFVVFGLVAWVTVTTFGRIHPRLGAPAHLVMGIITVTAFFGSLVVHELAHALVARRFGISVRGITLFVFGGMAEMGAEAPSPSREFGMALAGPATSIALGGLFALGALAASDIRWTAAETVLTTLALVNLGLAAFNLVPGLPLDGGRLLRAGLWRLTGSYRRATRVASWGGRLVAMALCGLGAYLTATGDVVGLWYVPMAVFLWFLTGASERAEPPPTGPTGALALGGEGQAAQPGP